MSIHLLSPSIILYYIYLWIELSIVLSTDILQNWNDYNAFQLPSSTAQREQIDMSHQGCDITMKIVSEDSSCSMVGWGARAACAEVSTGSVGDSKAMHGQKVHMDPGIYGRIRT
jgi:hypothetical protein